MSLFRNKAAFFIISNNSNNKKYCSKVITNSTTTTTTPKNEGVKGFQTIPGPLSLPKIGTLYQYLPLIGPYHMDRLHKNGFIKYKKFGPVVREEIVPGVNIVWLFNPEDFETLFRNEGKYPQRRSHLALEHYRLSKPNIYNTGGLLPTNGKEWWRLRSIFQKGLSSPQSVLNFIECSDEVVQEWTERLEKISLERPGMDYLPEFSRLFLELAGVTLLDISFGSFSIEELQSGSRTTQLIKSAYSTNSSILKTDNGAQLWRRFDTPVYRKLKKAQEFMESVAIDLINHKLRIFKEYEPNKALPLIESYLKSPELDMKDVIGIVCDFLLAGIDTTTYSTSFLFYHIARNPDVQEKLFDETRKLLPKSDSPVTKEALNEAHYAKAVLKETFRLNPISIGIGRILNESAVFSGYQVPAGTVVVTQNLVACRLEKYFDKPNEFMPERWLRDLPSYKAPHPFLVLPFGFGPRTCIAKRLAEQNILILMLKVIRNFKIEWNGRILDIKTKLINKPDGPVRLTFKRR